jgi:hypothetical protein
MEYVIEESKYYNEYGVCKSTTYFIKSWVPAIFTILSYWKYEERYDSEYRFKLSFESLEDAEKHVKEVLCAGKTVNGCETKDVSVIICGA